MKRKKQVVEKKIIPYFFLNIYPLKGKTAVDFGRAGISTSSRCLDTPVWCSHSLRAQGDPSRGAAWAPLRPPPPAPLPRGGSPMASASPVLRRGAFPELTPYKRSKVEEEELGCHWEVPVARASICCFFFPLGSSTNPPFWVFLRNETCISALLSWHGWDSSKSAWAVIQ